MAVPQRMDKNKLIKLNWTQWRHEQFSTMIQL